MTVHDHGPRPYEWVGDWSGRRAALTPDRVGLRDATTGEAYTYADLDRRANRVARLLREHGVTLDGGDGDRREGAGAPGESGGANEAGGDDARDGRTGGRVATISRNRPELVDLFLATGKTGGVLAPLSHRLAPPELATLLDDVAPELLVVEEPFLDLADEVLDEAGYGGPVLVLAADDGDDAGSGDAATGGEGGRAGRDDADDEGPAAPTDADDRRAWTAAVPDDGSPVGTADLALSDAHLFLHTGGSTGVPKETVLTHGGVVWNSINTITAWGLRDDDLTPMVFPMFHTGGWNVITLPLFHMGGEVAIAREFDPGEVLRIVDEDDATVLVAVPAVLRAMTEHDRWDEADLSSLRLVKSGGGPCREAVMEAWWDRGIDLSQGYGLTECGPNNFAMPDGWDRGKADSVGVPAMHVDARIVDGDGEEVPTGEIGELELASPHAGDRYWRNAEETAATFGAGEAAADDAAASSDGTATDDDGGGDGRAWVSTGDLARVDEAGYHYVEGRKKNMYVSGGENVFPAEVEDAIADHPDVAEVVVVPVPDEQWGQVGKAVIEPAPDAGDEPLTVDDLAAFLEGRLARFKRPRHVAYVAAMPTSGPDKIDREAVEERFGGG